MQTIGAYDARTRLSELLDKVKKGERITITKHGVPVAMLVPVERARTKTAAEVIRQLREFRKNLRLRGLSMKEAKETGRP